MINIYVNLCIFTMIMVLSPVIANELDKSVEMDQKTDLFNQLEKSSDKAFSDREQASENKFSDKEKELDAEWARMEAAEEKRWKDIEQAVLKKWDGYRDTTNKVWVDYDDNHEALSQVNFENGEVVVEALVPKDATPEQQKSALEMKIERLQESKDAEGLPVMENLLPKAETTHVLQNKEINEKPTLVHGSDGVDRLKVGVKFAMVPDHLERRAKKYFQKIDIHSKENGLDPALVLAIIHTESFFNPMAHSSIPAFGLMQIVPHSAGKEVYRRLYNKEVIPTSEYLYKPDNNILIGSTYLNILFKTYFSDVENADMRLNFVICAYNSGPTFIRNKIIGRIKLQQLSSSQVHEYLLKNVPKETHKYLIDVENRRLKYEAQL